MLTMYKVSYKHPRKRKLVYAEFRTLEEANKAPKEIVRNNQVYLFYGFHGIVEV